MRAHRDHRHRRQSRRDITPQRADDAARPAQRREQPAGQARRADEPSRPGLRPGVVELGGGRVGQLGADLAGEPVGQQVRDQQQGLRAVQLPGPGRRGELIDRVERQLLDPGHRVQLGRADPRGYLAGDPVGPAVAVVHRVAQQRAVRAEQAVVHGPRVDADAGQVRAPGRGAQPGQHVRVQPEDVPVQRAQHPDRLVAEPVRLAQPQRARPGPAGHHPAAGRAEIDRGDRHLPHGCPRRQRRNAAATPASTGISSPVVRVRSPAVSAITAAATCSGSTSCFSSVRCA